MTERVNLNDESDRKESGPLDEIYMENCTAHLEMMDHDAWYLGLTRPDGTVLQVWLRRKGKDVHGYFADEAGVHECPPWNNR